MFAAIGGWRCQLLAVVLYGLLRGGWLEALLAGIALGMSMLPEEFPVVLTVFMAMGAWRISQARVLTRRAAAIETLGSATVLCTDKTGTLTENRMSIAELRRRRRDMAIAASAGALPRASANWSSSAFSPARRSRSIRWKRRFTTRAAALGGTGAVHRRRGAGARPMACGRSCWPCTQVWQPADERAR